MHSRQILLGLVLGALAGLFFGEHIAFLEVVADGYVKLLQMTVLPFVLVSLVSGLGSLTHRQARTLGMRAGVLLLILWGIGLGLVFLFPLMFPATVTASFFSTTLLEPPTPFNFVDLYIPANPFRSLADNVVPAVVLFSIVLGVALIGVPDRQRLLDNLAIARQGLARAASYVSRLTPVGLFAIAAVTLGTLTVDQLSRLQVYLASYVVLSLVISLWILPAIITVVTPIPYRAILQATRGSLITAFVTGSLFIVLPTLVDETRELARRYGLGADDARATDVIVPASFNFPHIGKVLTISFVLFAGWFADAPVAIETYPALAATGLLTLFGSVNAAVPYLLDLFRIPADTFQLFIAMGVVNSRFGTLMAAMHTVTMALIGAWMVAGAARIDMRRLVRCVIVSTALTAAAVTGVRVATTALVDANFEGGQLLAGMGMLQEQGAANIAEWPPGSPDEIGGTALERLRARGTLRVGFFPDSLPFAYMNAAGDLVGFDAEMAHKLARELGLKLEFIRLSRMDLRRAFPSGACDIIMSGVVMTPDRAADVVFSTSYMDETMAFVAPDHARADFATWEQLRRVPIRLGVPDLPYYHAMLRRELPSAHVTTFDAVDRMFDHGGGNVDGFVLTAERGSAWTLLHPDLSVIVPMPDPIKVPLAYPVADTSVSQVVNVWIETARRDGTVRALYDYWILGRRATAAGPRWSIIRNVLHWVD